MNKLREADKQALKAMLDRSSVAGILDMLSEVCEEKGEHVATNWQDMPLANHWEKRARALSRIAGNNLYKD